MDYVIYGTGYGATLMLLGYAIRTWGPGWRFRDHDEDAYDRREFRTARAGWQRFMMGLGAVIATCGAVLALFTILLMLINPGDGPGVIVALIITAAILVTVAVWSWFYVSQNGSWGVLSSPEALSSSQPMRYENRPQPVPQQNEPAAESVHDDDVFEDEDERGDDESDEVAVDEGDFAARYSKYQLHHPEDREIVEGEPGEIGEVDDEVHEDVIAEVASEDDAGADARDEAADEPGANVSFTPEASEDVDPDRDSAAVETEPSAGKEDDVVVEEPIEATQADNAEALSVVPEAHEPGEADIMQTGTDDANAAIGNADITSSGEQADRNGSREDALRRLRERQERHRGERGPDV